MSYQMSANYKNHNDFSNEVPPSLPKLINLRKNSKRTYFFREQILHIFGTHSVWHRFTVKYSLNIKGKVPIVLESSPHSLWKFSKNASVLPSLNLPQNHSFDRAFWRLIDLMMISFTVNSCMVLLTDVKYQQSRESPVYMREAVCIRRESSAGSWGTHCYQTAISSLHPCPPSWIHTNFFYMHC